MTTGGVYLEGERDFLHDLWPQVGVWSNAVLQRNRFDQTPGVNRLTITLVHTKPRLPRGGRGKGCGLRIPLDKLGADLLE